MRGNGRVNAQPSFGAGIVVFDTRGDAFRQLRSHIGDVPMWWVQHAALASSTSGELAVVAVYGDADWRSVHEVVAKAPSAVVVAARPSPGDITRALTSGAFGYLDLQMPPEALHRALLGALRGEPAYPRSVLGEIVRKRTPAALGGKALSLTPRQREVLALIAQGAADKEIALALRIATGTAQKHVTNLLRTLGVPNRAAAVAASYGPATPAPLAGNEDAAASSFSNSSRLRASDGWSGPRTDSWTRIARASNGSASDPRLSSQYSAARSSRVSATSG
jgi:DNA-binding NarL/FixJ family response regulator